MAEGKAAGTAGAPVAFREAAPAVELAGALVEGVAAGLGAVPAGHWRQARRR